MEFALRRIFKKKRSPWPAARGAQKLETVAAGGAQGGQKLETVAAGRAQGGQKPETVTRTDPSEAQGASVRDSRKREPRHDQ